MANVTIYDTTLRDGSQGMGVTFSAVDKIKVAKRLDEFGVAYIEGGWPGSNPKDVEFFRRARDIEFKHAKLAAFGSTRRAKLAAEEDPQLIKLVEAQTPVVTIFGKAWDLHVKDVFRVSLDKNLEMIYDSVKFLVDSGREVIFDAEHFCDGYKSDPAFAIETLLAAERGGASCVVLCDTNGGSLPFEVAAMIADLRTKSNVPIGIHAHNDSDLAVAVSLMAVRSGAIQVQGTINGLGERCGNANLCTLMAVLTLKMKIDCLPEGAIEHLTELSRYVDEIANLVPVDRLPFVGANAFAHKAGVHVDALIKNPKTYEHITPETVGNSRRVLISELAGRSSIALMAGKFGVDLVKQSPEVTAALDQVAKLENEGWSFEDAEASFELMLKRSLGHIQQLFHVKGVRVIIEKRGLEEHPITEATLKVEVDGKESFTVAEGDGPVHALDNALRLGLKRFYSKELAKIQLIDFKVRVVNSKDGTAAMVRTVIESRDNNGSWSTVGVSTNIIEASWTALADSVEYGLLRQLGSN